MATKSPTLTDIRNLIAANHEEVQDKLRQLDVRQEKVEAQVILTNGRIKDLERDKIARDAIERYQQEAQAGSNPKVDWGKLLPYAVALCAALIAIGQAISK